MREDEGGARLFDTESARRASRALAGHPQALRLLRRYAQDHSEDLPAIIEEGVEAAGFGAEFAQRFLYTRILSRIRDPDVAKLAHPGLVLRRVTPQLIRDVLAQPCGFGEITLMRARELLAKFASTWIVATTEHPEVVHHRRDLRRMMLPAMMHLDPDEKRAAALRETAIAIHERAAAWSRSSVLPESGHEGRSRSFFLYRDIATSAKERFP